MNRMRCYLLRDRPAHMRFSGEVDHGVVARKDRPEQGGIADIALHEPESRAVADWREIGQARIGQLVQHGHAGLRQA